MWDDSSFYVPIYSIGKYLNVFPIMEKTSYSIHVFTFFFGCLLIIITIGFIIYSQVFSLGPSSNSSWSVRLLRIWILLLNTILSLPMFGILMLIMDCDNKVIRLNHNTESEIICFSNIHWLYFFIGIVFYVIFTIMISFFSLLFHESKLYSVKNLSVISGSYDFWLAIYKSGLVIAKLIGEIHNGDILLYLYISFGSLFLNSKYLFII